jgi:type IX secretion system PorP/SprF family membrane protein
MKIFTVCLVFSLAFAKTMAQDPHFSQFFSSPLTLNPAYTGKFDGLWRVAGNYRNQWPTINNAFTTFTTSVDFDIIQNKLPDFDTWGVGFLALSDRSGNKILQNNYLAFSTAYHKALDEDGYNQLTLGFQATYGQKRLDLSKATFEDQLTALGFTGVTAEVFSNQNGVNLNYFDVNTGIMYSMTTDGANGFYLGASMYHINHPKESFKGGDFSLSPRYTIHGGGYLPIDDNKMFHTSFIYQTQAGANEIVFGGALSFMLNEDQNKPTNLYGGLWYRVNDAFIPYIAVEIANLRIGYSYDINNSSLNTASNSRGGNEISLIYVQQPVDRSKKKLNCPKF